MRAWGRKSKHARSASARREKWLVSCTSTVQSRRGGLRIARERQHFAHRKRVFEARESAAHEQRLALPVAPHEARGRERTEGIAGHENGLESIRLTSDCGCHATRW